MHCASYVTLMLSYSLHAWQLILDFDVCRFLFKLFCVNELMSSFKITIILVELDFGFNCFSVIITVQATCFGLAADTASAVS